MTEAKITGWAGGKRPDQIRAGHHTEADDA